MVAVEQALRAGRVVRDHPRLLAAAAPLAAIAGLQVVVQGTPIASLSGLAVSFLVSPFFIAGLLGSVTDALDGTRPTRDRWLSWSRDRYVALLLAEVGVIAVVAAVSVPLTVLLAVGVAGFVFVGGPVGGGVAVVAGLLYLVAFVALLVAFAYYSASAVVGRERPVAALRESYRLARVRPATTLGYLVVSLVVGTTLGLPLVVLGWPFAAPEAGHLPIPTLSPSGATALALGAVGLVTSTLGQAYASTYLVCVYRAVGGGSAPEPP